MLSKQEEILWLDANTAKHGASDVASRLRNLMNEGVPSIADLAYTVRIREKEDYRIVGKVLRKLEKDPTYSVSRIRDIIGLRIVTLYRLDAIDIIPRLLEYMKSHSSNPNSLFFDDKLEEIKIFSTNPKGDAQVLAQRLVGLFDYLGYGDQAIIEDVPSNYTSIHLVTWCRGAYRGGYERVPIEIQIRTALEDAWGEIDHKLKYKRPDRKLSVRDELVLKDCLAHLNVMKNFVDGAAQYADQIKVQADQVTARRFLSTSHRVLDDSLAKIRTMNLPPFVQSQMEAALDQQIEAMHPMRRSREYADSRIGNLRNAIRELEASTDLVREKVTKDNSHKSFLLEYLIPLELALCKFQLAVELRNDRGLLADAIRIYEDAQKKFADRAIIRYRAGRALAALGDYPAAIQKLKEAHDLLTTNKDTTIDKNHWLRLSGPRNLGVVIWEHAEALRADKAQLEPLGEGLLEKYLEAYKITREAYLMKVDTDALADRFDTETNYKGRLVNNLLYYAADYLDLKGPIDALEKCGFKESEIEDHLSLLEKHFDCIETPSTLHTMLRYYIKLDRKKLRHKCAYKLYRVLRELGVTDSGGKSHEEEMLRIALAHLPEGNMA